MTEFLHKNLQAIRTSCLAKKKALKKFHYKYQVRYSGIRLCKENNDIPLLNKKENKVLISVDHIISKMYHVNNVFNKGPRPSFIREEFFDVNWLRSILANTRPSLENAISHRVSVSGTITHNVRMDNFSIGVVFVVVRNLAPLLRLEIAFMDRFANGIFPP